MIVSFRGEATEQIYKGDRKSQHSIRINDKYRLCFAWTGNGVEGVEIVDYH